MTVSSQVSAASNEETLQYIMSDYQDLSRPMRVKRLCDNLGGQIIATKLIRLVPSNGYQINSPKGSAHLEWR